MRTYDKTMYVVNSLKVTMWRDVGQRKSVFLFY